MPRPLIELYSGQLANSNTQRCKVPLNLNPKAKELLEWHGHDRRGVHVPFQLRKNPFGGTIETRLILKLLELADAIAANEAHEPRWIFLVGVPGNGKSETVQDFLAR